MISFRRIDESALPIPGYVGHRGDRTVAVLDYPEHGGWIVLRSIDHRAVIGPVRPTDRATAMAAAIAFLKSREALPTRHDSDLSKKPWPTI